MADVPSRDSLETTKVNMDTVDEFVYSENDSLIDQYGKVRQTFAAIEKRAEGLPNPTYDYVDQKVTLTSGQVVVEFTSAIDCTKAAFYIGGDDVDKGRLTVVDEYAVDSQTQITLSGSYPAGSWVTAVMNDVAQAPTIKFTAPPVGATNSGLKGEMRIDDDYLYVCVADDSWKRTPLTTW